MKRIWLAAASLLLLTMVGCGGGGSPTSSTTNVPTGSVQGRLASSGSRQVQGRFVAKVHGVAKGLAAQVRSDGFFRIDGVPAGEQTITVEDVQTLQGAVIVAFVRPGQVTDVGEIKPQPLGKVSGIVAEVDESGNRKKPIARARVTARPVTGEQDTLQDLSARPLFVAFTNPNGSYELLLPAGTYYVEASHPDYEPSADVVTVQALQTVALDFGLLPRRDTGIVYGTVTAEVNGQIVPVAGALVALVPEGVQPLPVGSEQLLPPPPPDMTVGQIVSALQNPVKGIKGKMHPENGHHRRRPLFTFTKADGSYELTGVPAGDYTAIAFKRGFGRDEKDKISVPSNDRVEVNFVLRASFVIVRGKVTDAETGRPIGGALVFATRWGDPWFIWDEWEADDDRPDFWVYPMPMLPRHSGHGHGSGGHGSNRPMPVPPPMPIIEPPVRTGTLTDANGNYQLLLPAGEYFISAVKEGYEWQGVRVTVVEEQTVTVNFALSKIQPPPNLSSISVELLVKPQVQLGETVTIQLKVRNNGNRPVTLTFTNPPEADFVVMTEDGVEIWRWSHGKMFIASGTNSFTVPPPVTLLPGEEKQYEVEWDQKDNDGNPVPTGTYLVQGILNTTPPIETEPKPLQIVQ